MKLYREETIDISSKSFPKIWLKDKIIFKIFKFCKPPIVIIGLLQHIIFNQKTNPKVWINDPKIKEIIKKYNLLDYKIPKVFLNPHQGYIRKLKMFEKHWDYNQLTDYSIRIFDFRFYYCKILRFWILNKYHSIKYKKYEKYGKE